MQYRMTMTVLILALLLAVASLSLAEDHYVSAHNGKDCPVDSDCHSLSYYLSDPELYFTSNTRITFLKGTHLLDREEPVKISQVTDLTLFGSGQWVHGPEETIMESTAVIYCTKGSGGFAFYSSSKIAVTKLSLINCGAFHSDAKVLKNDFYTTLLFAKISKLSLHSISIQNSTGHGLVLYNCPSADILSLSVVYSNIDRKSDKLQCNKFANGSNLMILFQNSNTIYKQIPIRSSNFTDGCVSNSQYGSVVLRAVNSRSVDVSLVTVKILQRFLNGRNGILIWSNNSSVWFELIDSKVTGTGTKHNRGIWLKALASLEHTILMERVSFINHSGGQLCFEFHGGIISFIIMKNISFIHRNVPKPDKYGVYISADNKIHLAGIIFQNITLSLGNAFSTGLLLDIVKTRQYLSTTTTSIQIHNSFFGANKNMKSVMILNVNIPANITNCVFIDNSGDSVTSVSTTDQLLFNNVTFTNNNMTAVEVWNGALQFIGINKIQNNHGTGVHYLQGSSYINISSNSELNFLNNTARTVGGAVLVSDKRKFQNDYCSILVSNDSRIIFSGNRAVEGGGDVYGARLVDCRDIDHNIVPRQFARPTKSNILVL